MTKPTTTPYLLFPDLEKPVVAQFDQEHASSDGGALLLKAADRRLGLIDPLSRCLPDENESGKVRHELSDLVSQRVFGLACGYADRNDAARLAEDPIHKALLGRDPIDGDALASQSTLSRFKNAVGPKDLARFGEALAVLVIRRRRMRLRGKARRAVSPGPLDEDPVHTPAQVAGVSPAVLALAGVLSAQRTLCRWPPRRSLRRRRRQGSLGFLDVPGREFLLVEAGPSADQRKANRCAGELGSEGG